MRWTEAEAAIRAHIEAGWAGGPHAAMPLYWEAEGSPVPGDTFVSIAIDGAWAEKTRYGSVGKRVSIEGGIVYFHAFAPPYAGKAAVTAPVDYMSELLELQVIATGIQMDGANPPSPVADGPGIPRDQPEGNYFRCSGSVPFTVIGTR